MAKKDQPPRIARAGAPQHWEGVADPSYLLAEINELRLIAQKAGMGTLAYMLEMAEIEAKHQVRPSRNQIASEPAGVDITHASQQNAPEMADSRGHRCPIS